MSHVSQMSELINQSYNQKRQSQQLQKSNYFAIARLVVDLSFVCVILAFILISILYTFSA